MTFQKGNKEGAKGKGVPKGKLVAWNNIVGWLCGDGGVKFKDLIEDLSDGREINKSQQEFLGHFKDLLEYHQPKLSRRESKKQTERRLDQILDEIENDR